MNQGVQGSTATYGVFVEEVEDHVGQTRVAPVPVDQEELLQVLKAWKSKITGHHRLQTQRENINQYDTPPHAMSTAKREKCESLCELYG